MKIRTQMHDDLIDIPSLSEMLPGCRRSTDADAKYLIDTGREYLRKTEEDFKRLNELHRAGKIQLKFDFKKIVRDDDVKLAEENSIDYVGICLYYNEKYDRNPYTKQQMMEKGYDFWKKRAWFSCRYHRDDQLQESILREIRKLVYWKKLLASYAS